MGGIYDQAQQDKSYIDTRLRKVQSSFQKTVNKRLDHQTLKVISYEEWQADLTAGVTHPETQVSFVVKTSGGATSITAYKGDIELSNSGGATVLEAALGDIDGTGGIFVNSYQGQHPLTGSDNSVTPRYQIYSGAAGAPCLLFNADFNGGNSLPVRFSGVSMFGKTEDDTVIGKSVLRLFIERGGAQEMLVYKLVNKLLSCSYGGSHYTWSANMTMKQTKPMVISAQQLYIERYAIAGGASSLIEKGWYDTYSASYRYYGSVYDPTVYDTIDRTDYETEGHMSGVNGSSIGLIPAVRARQVTLSGYADLTSTGFWFYVETTYESKSAYDKYVYYGSDYIGKITDPDEVEMIQENIRAGTYTADTKTVGGAVDVPYLSGYTEWVHSPNARMALGLTYSLETHEELDEPHLIANANEQAVNYIFMHESRAV